MLRFRVLHAIAFLHETRPQAPAGAELRDLIEEVHVHVEEERQALGELLDIAAAAAQFFDVRQTVGQGVRHFLGRRGARVAHVGAGNTDGVEARRNVIRIQYRIGDQPHRRAHRKDPGAARDILLQDVVLNGPGEFLARHALLVGDRQVHRIDDRGRAVDGEGGRDL